MANVDLEKNVGLNTLETKIAMNQYWGGGGESEYKSSHDIRRDSYIMLISHDIRRDSYIM